jgi:predicted ATPase
MILWQRNRSLSLLLIRPFSWLILGARIYLLDEDGCREIAYEETEHYRLTRDFLSNYPQRLKQLFTDASDELEDADE